MSYWGEWYVMAKKQGFLIKYIHFGVCPLNVYFPRDVISVSPLLLGSILVSKHLLIGDYRY